MLQNSYSFKKVTLEEKLPEVEILVVGNSHAFYGINPDNWPVKGFNLANVSQSLDYDNLLIADYLDKLPNLKFVIIPLDYFTLGYKLKSSVEEWRMFFYKRYWNIEPHGFSLIDLRRYSLIELYGRNTALKYALKQFKVNLAENINRHGAYESVNVLANPTGTAALKRVQFHNSLINENINPQNKQLLEHIINNLKSRNITPVLISTPVSTYYFAQIDKEKINFFEDTVSGIAHSNGLKYYNYMNDLRFTTSDFSDYDHLNITGAAIFSKIIYEEITGQPLSK